MTVFKKILKIIIVMALTFSMSIPLINVYAFEENMKILMRMLMKIQIIH